MISANLVISGLLKPGISHACQACGLNITLEQIKNLPTYKKACYAALLAVALTAVAVCPQLRVTLSCLFQLATSLTGIAAQLVMLGIYLTSVGVQMAATSGTTLLARAKDLFSTFFRVGSEDLPRGSRKASLSNVAGFDLENRNNLAAFHENASGASMGQASERTEGSNLTEKVLDRIWAEEFQQDARTSTQQSVTLDEIDTTQVKAQKKFSPTEQEIAQHSNDRLQRAKEKAQHAVVLEKTWNKSIRQSALGALKVAGSFAEEEKKAMVREAQRKTAQEQDGQVQLTLIKNFRELYNRKIAQAATAEERAALEQEFEIQKQSILRSRVRAAL